MKWTNSVLCLLCIFFLLVWAAKGDASGARFGAFNMKSKIPLQDTFKELEFRNVNRYTSRTVDSGFIRTFAGKVVVYHEGTLFYCDSAVYSSFNRVLEAFGNIHINDGDSIHAYGQYLKYLASNRYAYLSKNVKLTDKKAILTTSELEYDIGLKIGIYKNGGTIKNGNSVLTSQDATYYSDLREAFFKRNVRLKDPKYNLQTDSLLYNLNAEKVTFITETTIIDSSKRKIITSDGYYDLKIGKAELGKNPLIIDGAVSITGIKVAFDDKSGISQVEGNGVLIDTAQGITVLANQLFSNKNSGALLATKKPLLIIKQKTDSIYIAADTLFSGKLSDLPRIQDSTKVLDADFKNTMLYASDSLAKKENNKKLSKAEQDSANKNRFFEAYHHVRIFSDSVQAVCDSLFYSGIDSVFRMFKDPVAWANKSQITGDTMYLYTRNKQPERVQVFNNGLAVNQSDSNLFNQLAGYTINAYFTEGKINYIRSRGEAETIYYIMDDDSAYTSVSRMSSEVIDFRFDSLQDLEEIAYIFEPKGENIPIQKVNPKEMLLRGFSWREALRPKNKFELFE